MAPRTRRIPGKLACLTWLLVLTVTSACHMGYAVRTTPYPAIDPRQHHQQLATICVLRPHTFGALALFLHLDNGRMVGATQGKQVYFCYRAEPGWHRLLARSDNDATLPLRAYAGQVHFVELKVNMGPDELVLLSASRGHHLHPHLRYVIAYPTSDDHPPPLQSPVPARPDPLF